MCIKILLFLIPWSVILLPLGLDSGRFHLAASKGLTECLTILIANGADINSKNEDGELDRALDHAAHFSLCSSGGGRCWRLLGVPTAAPCFLPPKFWPASFQGFPSLQAGYTSPTSHLHPKYQALGKQEFLAL